MTSFFVEKFENVCTITKFSAHALGFFIAERERSVSIFGKQKAVWGWKEQGIMV